MSMAILAFPPFRMCKLFLQTILGKALESVCHSKGLGGSG